MDNTTNSSTPTTPPVQASPAAPAPTPPSAPTGEPTPSTPTGTPPLSTTPPSSPPSTPTAKKPFPLRWALVGIGVIVVLAGSILGILAANNKQTAYTTETEAAGSSFGNANRATGNGGQKWPFGSLPNVMLEKDTLRVDTDDKTGDLSIHGQIVFAKHLNSGAECWVVWASTTSTGKLKDRVGTPFPKGLDQLNPPNPPCPKPGGFNTGSGYPAVATRPFGPLPSENEGVLNNPNATPFRYFDIYNIDPRKLPKDTCKLYLNYRSNRQEGVPFYELTLPSCLPTATPAAPTPTMPRGRIPSPTPENANVPPGCSLITKYEAKNGSDNWGTCDETCGLTKENKICAPSAQNAKICTKQACRAGVNNTQKIKQGAWYCCTRGSCDMPCTTSNDCSGGLRCVAGKCKDVSNCASTGTCKCLPGDTPATPTPEPTDIP